MTPPPYQWQPFYAPPAYDSTMVEQILSTVTGNAAQTKQQAANDIARDILRTVERNGQENMSTTERVNAQLASAVERNGAIGASTTERVNAQLASAVERTGAANYAAIERSNGESRLTTVVTDAASRQFANDSARDIVRAIDRSGLDSVTTTKDAYNGLMTATERSSGENRIQTLSAAGQLTTALTDVRHTVINDVTRGFNDVNTNTSQMFSILNKSVSDSAWEQRSALNSGIQSCSAQSAAQYSSILLENAKIAAHNSDHCAVLMLEQQKMKEYLSSKGDNHFAINQLEMQKVREGLSSQASNQFAINQLEMQKVKEGLSSQAANNFAVGQLEAQKNREAIQMQLADAKYEALKSQQYLTDKIGECCCEVKQKIDLIDRDRLRDNLVVSRDKNNLLETVEFLELYGRGDRRRDDGRGDRRH
jgi:hypothetical protein